MPADRDSRGVLVDAPLIGVELQHRWHVPHATWFTLMGVGGGVFLLSRLLGIEARLGLWLGLPVVDLVSFLAIAVGGLILIADLGRPLRFIQAVLRPQTSWISRGAIADFVFLVAGGVLVLPGLTLGGAQPFAGLPWDPWASGTAGAVLEWAALLSAAIVIYYAGQVLADSTAIPYWRSPAIPIQFVLSSLAISMGTVMLLQTLSGDPIGAGEFWLLAAFLAPLAAVILWHLRTDRGQPGKAESLDRLWRWPFLGGVLGAGTLLPLILGLIGVAAEPGRDALGIVALACTTAGGFALRLMTLRVGFFAPVTATIRMPGRPGAPPRR
jgi:formate-dependent nitrite reductase membrane component NrfD